MHKRDPENSFQGLSDNISIMHTESNCSESNRQQGENPEPPIAPPMKLNIPNFADVIDYDDEDESSYWKWKAGLCLWFSQICTSMEIQTLVYRIPYTALSFYLEIFQDQSCKTLYGNLEIFSGCRGSCLCGLGSRGFRHTSQVTQITRIWYKGSIKGEKGRLKC